MVIPNTIKHGVYGKWWDMSDVANTLTVHSHNQYMPDKDNFEAVVTFKDNSQCKQESMTTTQQTAE